MPEENCLLNDTKMVHNEDDHSKKRSLRRSLVELWYNTLGNFNIKIIKERTTVRAYGMSAKDRGIS